MMTATDNARAALRKGDTKTAIDLCARTLRMCPGDRDALRLLGIAELARGRREQAKKWWMKGLQQYPNDPVMLASMASYHHFAGNDEKAEAYIEKATARSDEPIALYTRSLIRLKNGDYRGGFIDYEYRFVVGTVEMKADPRFYWQGERLGPDTTLTVWCEQGAGDCIQFVRYVKDAAARSGAKIKLACYPELWRLFEPLGFELTDRIEGFHCPMMSLPRILRLTPEGVNGEPYLHLRERAADPLKVGLCWMGRRDTPELADRSLRTEQVEPILDAGVEIRSLQLGQGLESQDFEETAEAIAECGLVVTIDTSVAHLAGAMGVPTWLMLRYQGDWRWGHTPQKTRWYDSMKLYRQPRLGDWTSVVNEVVKDLKEYANG